MTLASAFVASSYPTQSGTAYPLAIDNDLTALAFAAQPFQPTVTNADMVVHVAAGTVPTASGVTTVAAQSVTLATADATHDRIDLVVLDRVTAAVMAVAGTPASSPVAPAVPAGKLPCCQMTVKAAATSILSTNGADTRWTWMIGLGAAGFKALGDCVVDDGSGSLTVNASLLTAASSVDLANDAVLIYSASAGAPRKAAPNLLGGVTQTQFAALQQDVIQNYLLDAINGAWAAGQYSNGGYDAFNSDTLSGVTGTANQTYDSTNHLYVSLTNSPSYSNLDGTGNRTSSITVTISGFTLASGTVSQIVDGSYANAWSLTSAASAGAYIQFDFGVGASKVITEVTAYKSGAYDSGYWQFAGSNDGTTWTNIGSPLDWGSSATFVFSLSSNTTGYRYYRMTITSGTMSAAPWYQEFEFKICNTPLGTQNMTLVGPALNPAPATAPTGGKLLLLWKDLSTTAVLNTDFTAELTENGGTNWVSGTLSDTGITMAGGFHVLTASITLSSGGTTVQYRLKALNNKSQQVKAVGLMTQ